MIEIIKFIFEIAGLITITILVYVLLRNIAVSFVKGVLTSSAIEKRLEAHSHRQDGLSIKISGHSCRLDDSAHNMEIAQDNIRGNQRDIDSINDKLKKLKGKK